MTPDEGIAIWTYIGAHCAGTQLDASSIELRGAELTEFSFERGMAAAREWIRLNKWMPTTSELIELVVNPDLPSADEVWQEILELVTARGWPSPPTQGDCSLAAWLTIQRMGGWQRVCEGTEVVDRAHVLKYVAPAVIDRIRRNVLTEGSWPELPPAPPTEELGDGEG